MPDLGTLTFTIPYLVPETTINQDYLNDLDYETYTGNTTFTGVTYFTGIGQSRVSELKLYGSNTYSGVTYYSGGSTGYTIDQIRYRDYPEGYTILTGNTANYTKEEIFNQMLTRNEHFLGFIEEPTIYSDVFVERGKQGVMENNLRLSEIDNLGELMVYGNGFFNIRKQ